MALSEYDIKRISSSIVETLVTDERFMRRVSAMTPQLRQLVSLSAAAELLGVSCSWMAHHIDGFRTIKGTAKNAPYKFDTQTLYEDYEKIINEKRYGKLD